MYITINKTNTDRAEQRRNYFERYLVFQECTHWNHTEAGRKMAYRLMEILANITKRSYQLTQAMTST